MEASTAQAHVSLMRMRPRLARVVGLAVIAASCEPAGEVKDNVACREQSSPSAQRACYVEFEPRYAAVVRTLGVRELAAGADSASVRLREAAFESALRACGTRPDTSGRPSAADLAIWSCREATFQREMVARTPR